MAFSREWYLTVGLMAEAVIAAGLAITVSSQRRKLRAVWRAGYDEGREARG